jgi:hypothetical protein
MQKCVYSTVGGRYVGNRPIKLSKSTWEKRMATSEEYAQKVQTCTE